MCVIKHSNEPSVAGDCVRIDEETLDRQHYIVTIMQSGESGRVPKEFVDVGE